MVIALNVSKGRWFRRGRTGSEIWRSSVVMAEQGRFIDCRSRPGGAGLRDAKPQ